LDTGEILGLAAWMGALSSFLLVNNYVGPFPADIASGAIPQDMVTFAWSWRDVVWRWHYTHHLY
jgi:hypothetical protein